MEEKWRDRKNGVGRGRGEGHGEGRMKRKNEEEGEGRIMQERSRENKGRRARRRCSWFLPQQCAAVQINNLGTESPIIVRVEF